MLRNGLVPRVQKFQDSNCFKGGQTDETQWTRGSTALQLGFTSEWSKLERKNLVRLVENAKQRSW